MGIYAENWRQKAENTNLKNLNFVLEGTMCKFGAKKGLAPEEISAKKEIIYFLQG